ncbi:MAG: carbohydrate binding domain-containing protein [Lachnospiraceae bacterium]|nr:carbohydrate binding domain-containing protein [Lachnospiraceae bacterium]
MMRKGWKMTFAAMCFACFFAACSTTEQNAGTKEAEQQTTQNQAAENQTAEKTTGTVSGEQGSQDVKQEGENTGKDTETMTEQEMKRNDINLDGYTLVWEDNFDGDSLNREDWNVETHEPGWVNEEWQAYVDSEENIQVKDGKLYIYPVKKQNKDGSCSYTSGRISTQNKQDFTYGMFEVSAKVPLGKGYLPAFWLMATDENIYGQWPRCGEIDIMEVLGDKPKAVHGTIHYGNPHNQSQGTYNLSTIENFTSDFHTFTCEWEPGSIKWYVDGIQYHEESDWYSTTVGQGTLTYPAPFDQPFYIILNLAVGGSWVGYPDESTSFDNNPYIVEYVRVYQKDSYDENVTRPVEEVVLREPDADGNYVTNGTFAEEEKLNDGKGWKFLTAQDGKGEAVIKDNMLTIESTAEGLVDYSVQLVQPNIPLEKGSTYEISFEAYASENRTFHLAIKAPDRNWIEYFPTTTVELGTEPQTYTYQVKMKDASDGNGRLEFNMGAAGSVGTIYLTNVSVKKLSEATGEETEEKTILADGNYIYNGKFQEGDGHLGFWEISGTEEVEISVTDFADGRRLKVVRANADGENNVVVAQSSLAITAGQNYMLSFEAESDVERELTILAGGMEFKQAVGTGKNSYTLNITTSDSTTNDFAFVIGKEAGTLYLDEVRLIESAMILNGSFNAGFSGYEWYVDSSADAVYVVDSLTEDNALDVTVKNTSDQDWKVQVKQNNVKLEQGRTYTLTFTAKSSLDRTVRVLLQGQEDRGWFCYSGDGYFNLNSEYQTFTITFTMEEATDEEAFLSICLGMVDEVITTQHRIIIDNITLCEVE